jgi:citrate lyase subunit beta / citryl-CoA lyase
MTYRPRRSALYMPGANAKALAKARTLLADAVILDLEDAVAPEAKVEARGLVATTLAEGGFGQRETVIRINALETPWGRDDLAMAVAARPDAILAPKITGPADVEAVDDALSAAGAGQGIGLWIMIETPQAVLDLGAIVAMAGKTRLSCLVMGTNDLAKDMRARRTPDRAAFLAALSLTVMAARTRGLDAIDGVFNAIDDPDGFAAECAHGRVLGFDGKTLIHPSQIEAANAAFAPEAAEVAHARAVIAAFADPANAGKGVLKVDGKMTELLHLEEARRTVAMADAIAAMQGEVVR